MRILENIGSGVELTHPQATPRWMIGAVVCVILLLAAIAVGTWLFNMGKNAVSGVTGTVSGAATGAAKSFFGS